MCAFPQPFFQAMHRALKPGGIVCTQVIICPRHQKQRSTCSDASKRSAHELHEVKKACCRRRKASGCICPSSRSWPACAIECLRAAAYSMRTQPFPHIPGTMPVMCLCIYGCDAESCPGRPSRLTLIRCVCSGQIGFMICSKKSAHEPLDTRMPRQPAPVRKDFPALRHVRAQLSFVVHPLLFMW